MEPNICVIHPSRGRPEKAYLAYEEWVKNADHDFDYILSIDNSDPSQSNYFLIFKDCEIIMSPNRSIVQAVNVAAKQSTADILVVMSDDFGCPKGWDTLIRKNLPADRPALIKINDTIQSDIVTLPILNRSLYEKLGWIYHPSYISMFVDNDLTESARVHGEVIELNTVFEHRHWINGKSPKDATYERENSQVAWNIGNKLFEQRKKQGFR